VWLPARLPVARRSCTIAMLTIVGWSKIMKNPSHTMSTSRGAAPCRGWPASGPGRLWPGPWFLAGVSVEVSSVKRDLACTFASQVPPAPLSCAHCHA
jgi:hypothetical protein